MWKWTVYISELGRTAPKTLPTACATQLRTIAPTATISNIIGVDPSSLLCYERNLSVKSNLSGELIVINGYLVRDLKRLGLDDVMVMN
jgi:ribonucleotide reductase alpha subunit